MRHSRYCDALYSECNVVICVSARGSSYNSQIDSGAPPVCGDDTCDEGEDQCNCPQDCWDPPSKETICSDGIDDDCDGLIDCGDIDDCGDDPACTCLPKDSPCDYDSDCCSGKCHPRKGCL